jgi:UDP-N-acetylmuramoyl-L-alanyl-D-glutamate--2,6-diaminopimelate ligase
MLLRQLVEELPILQISGPIDMSIGSLEWDSRRVEPGDVFVAIRGGQEQDRHLFIPHALERGARAIIVEEEGEHPGATQIVVANCRQALAKLAARYYNYPGRSLRLVGITGTNGKTTTALLLQQVLEAAGVKCGYLGTLGRIVSDGFEPLANTTPEAPELHRQLRGMVDAGKRAAVLEASSHGLALERVSGLQFTAAVFTNFTRDHLDFHLTEENYFAAKARLFEELDESAGGIGVVNVDDPVAEALIGRIGVPVTTYGWGDGAAIRLLAMEPNKAGMRLRVQTPSGELDVDTPLTGRFNSYNVIAALATGLGLGLDVDAVRQGIAAVERIPGRFEQVVAGQGFQVIVDYAHTPDGLETVLKAARELTRERLICVFGCGGDRDRGKRPQMGRIGAERADLVFLTSDNPRSEDPEEILAEIASGMESGANAQILENRGQAIKEALTIARQGDVVVIAGKGHEAVQILAEGTVPFDDREVARQVLEELTGRSERERWAGEEGV